MTLVPIAMCLTTTIFLFLLNIIIVATLDLLFLFELNRDQSLVLRAFVLSVFTIYFLQSF